jgi:hypothetical protein
MKKKIVLKFWKYFFISVGSLAILSTFFALAFIVPNLTAPKDHVIDISGVPGELVPDSLSKFQYVNVSFQEIFDWNEKSSFTYVIENGRLNFKAQRIVQEDDQIRIETANGFVKLSQMGFSSFRIEKGIPARHFIKSIKLEGQEMIISASTSVDASDGVAVFGIGLVLLLIGLGFPQLKKEKKEEK